MTGGSFPPCIHPGQRGSTGRGGEGEIYGRMDGLMNWSPFKIFRGQFINLCSE